MLRRSGARRLGVTQAAAAVQAHLLIGVSARRALNRGLIVTKCEADAGASRLLKGTLRVFAISDLHTHHRENLIWVRQLSTTEHQHDVLIVAGDISDDLEDLRVTLLALRQRFAVVFFCPGNHELWVSGRQRHHREGFSEVPWAAAVAQELQPKGKQAGPKGEDGGGQSHKPAPAHQPHQMMVHDSLDKLAVVMALSQELGVHVMPARLGRLRIVPLLAWHHKSFDKEPDIPGIPKASSLTISDYARCMWPARMVPELEAMRRFGSCPVRQHGHQIQDQHHHHQQQQPDGHVMGDCGTSTPDPSTADDPTAFPKAKGKNSGGSCGGSCGGMGFGADWGDGGHGSDAVAAWFDALNEPPYAWGCVYSHKTRSNSIVDSIARNGISGNTDFGNTAGPAASAPLVCHQLDHLPEMLGGENTILNNSSSSCTTTTTTSTCSSRRSGTATNSSGSGSGGLNDSNGRPGDTERSVQAPQQGPFQQQQQQQHAQIPLPVACVDEGAAAAEVQDEDVISFSHFLPLQELLPEKRYLTFPNLAKAVGSTYLADRILRLRPQMHVFGHTHFAWDAVRDGIRYVQAPLAYPSERRFRLRSLVMTAAGGPQGMDRSGTTAGIAASIATTDAEASRAEITSAEAISRTLTSSSTTHISEAEAGLEARMTELQAGSLECRSKFSEAREEPTGQGEGHVGLKEQEGLTAPWPSSLDPGDGRWLPLCIYRAQYTVRVLPRGDPDVDGGCGVASEAAETVLDQASALAQPPQLQPVAKLLLRPEAGASTRGGVIAAGLGDESEQVPKVEVLEWRSQWCPEQAAMWSSYYKRHSRRPHELQLAPWVAERYSRRLRRSVDKQALGSSATAAAVLTSASSPLTSAEDASLEGKAGDGMGTDTLASGEINPDETELE
ncbi:hypothetical protein VaNZ11_011370 [Volvox africanus]|uniref:Calcineurin-like phosphoesterase domain-containing protein n=1 Tax=Volvox africanus TaxID=51714 RepID=A0ABQ5SB38_9CHLO|nr:hypothetical protein VaNZ11_011370 [Volvox africanus]